ncbi:MULTISPECIES: tripartite tricarboxylate transporter substrate binding protein [Pigmentiphaga]|uniref:Tripartite tricarboxylate transporter substrate binding protein n=1 Tax=Pigmentiphaga daeguensis TaxID=414049 RepID=A0ABP3M6G8_9BURK
MLAKLIPSVRLAASTAAAALLLLAAGPARAQQAPWPQKLVRIQVAFAPGASTDNVTRKLAAIMSKSLGQAVAVENRQGAMGAIAMSYVARESPDGYTLAANDSSSVIVPNTTSKVPYNLQRDFTPIAAVMFSPLGIAVKGDSPFKTLQDFIRAAKAHPGRLTYGTGGAGSSTHLAMAELANEAGIELTHIPYKGAGEALLALMGGQIDAQFASPSTVMGHIETGKLRMLAISGDAPPAALPGVPTFAKAGLPNYSFFNWIGYWAPKGTPTPVVDRLQREIVAALATDEMKAYAQAIGATPRVESGEAFAQLIEHENARIAGLVAKLNIEKQ